MSLQSLCDDIVKHLATLGVHFHTLLRPLCTVGRPFGVPWPSLGSFVGLFWHTRGPKGKILKKGTALDPKGSLFVRVVPALFHNNRGCVWAFVCMSCCGRFLAVFRIA